MNNMRRACLMAPGSLIGLTGCGGGEYQNSAGDSLTPEKKAATSNTTNSSGASKPATTPQSAIPRGNPLVTPDARRNYIFGPTPATAMTGFANVGVGENTLRRTTTGSWNTAIGDQSLHVNTEGLNNVGVGALALFSSINTIDCTAVGVEALKSARSGVGATAIGRLACSSLLSAENNTGIGDSSLRFLITGSGNTAVGYTSAEYFNEGSSNTFVGAECAKNMPSGNYNTVIGAHSLFNSALGYDNVAIGAFALYETKGISTVAVGMRAGAMTSNATRSVFLGGMAGGLSGQASSVDNVTVIGHGAVATRSHQVVVGNAETQEFILGDLLFSKEELTALLRILRQNA